MKKLGLLVFIQLLLFSIGFAQKSKLKEQVTTEAAAQDSTNKDSIRGKAAIRGTANMQSARDSLRGANFDPPVNVVDTFNVIREYRPGQTKLRREQIEAAEKRLAEVRELLEKAKKKLEKVRKAESVSEEKIEEIALRIDDEMKRLVQSEARIKTLRKDWLEKTGLPD